MGELEQLLAAHIADAGPIGFDDYMAHALYAPGLGFYASGRGAGRRRDFLTSPEVGPLFGAIMARALDAWWQELGRPSRFVVVEAGAGPGMWPPTIGACSRLCPACRDCAAAVLSCCWPEPACSAADARRRSTGATWRWPMAW